MKSKTAYVLIGASLLLFFHKHIFWDATQRGLYRAYNEAQIKPGGVALKSYLDFEWDKFCVVSGEKRGKNDRDPLYGYPISATATVPDLNEDGVWAIAFIKEDTIFRITKVKDVYEDNTQKCFNASATMKVAPLQMDTIPRPRIIFEN